MGAKTQQVGGGGSTAVANDFAKFLQTGLQQGFPTGQMPAFNPYQQQQPLNFGGGPQIGPGYQSFDQPLVNMTGMGPGGAMNGAFGSLGDTGLNQQGPMQNFANANPIGQTQGIGQNIGQQLAGYQGQLGVNTGQLAGMANNPGFDFGQFQAPGMPNFNVQGAFNNPQLQGLFNQIQQFAGGALAPQPGIEFGGGPNGIGANKTEFNLGNVDLSPYQQLLQRENQKSLGDIRARFGQGGGAAFGTPAAFAEANLTAEQSARNAAQMAEIGRAQQGLELARQQQAADIDARRYGSELAASAAQAGAGAGARASMFGNALGALGDLYRSGLSGIGQENQYGLGGAELASRHGLGVGQLRNDFLGMGANNAIQQQGLNQDALAKALGLDLQGQAMNLQNFGGRGDFLSNLLGFYGQQAGLGTPQAQMIQKPSTFQNIMGGVSGIVGGAAPYFSAGGIFGKKP